MDLDLEREGAPGSQGWLAGGRADSGPRGVALVVGVSVLRNSSHWCGSTIWTLVYGSCGWRSIPTWVTSHHLLPLVVDRPGGLLVEITDGTAGYNAERYRISVYYDLAKAAVNRLGFSQGHELQPHGATALAVTPGWLRSEMMLGNFGVTEDNWRDALVRSVDGYPAAPEGFETSESPRYIGRGVAALAADPDRERWNQQSVTAADLARAYGFTDIDGTQPDSWSRH